MQSRNRGRVRICYFPCAKEELKDKVGILSLLSVLSYNNQTEPNHTYVLISLLSFKWFVLFVCSFFLDFRHLY